MCPQQDSSSLLQFRDGGLEVTLVLLRRPTDHREGGVSSAHWGSAKLPWVDLVS